MKHILFLLLIAFPWTQCFSQQQNRAVNISIERKDNGDIVFSSENKDFCNYYVSLNFPDLRGYMARGTYPCDKNVSTGKTDILTLKKVNDSSGSNYAWSYSIYRGYVGASLNLDYIYSLPVKSGDSIRAMPTSNIELEILFNMKFTNDTVYACRAGRVCDSELTDMTSKSRTSKKRIIVYHKDRSFSEYSRFYESLVYPGDYVEVGQAIAIVKPNEKNQKQVSFSVYFLDKNKMKDADTGRKHSSLVPVFHSANKGNEKLEEKTTYVSELTSELIMQEMSKEERKKHEKKLARTK